MAIMSSEGQEWPIDELNGHLHIFHNEEGWNVQYECEDVMVYSIEDEIGYALYQFNDLLREAFWKKE